MRPNPLVTIITSCYNHEKYLDDYFEGLLSQTYTQIQLILIDDGSTDGSWAKICSYKERLRAKFPSVFLEQHENIGPGPEFLRVFDRVKGELFCILESDDYYLPTKIEENVRYLQLHPDVGAVHSEIDYIYENRLERRHWETVGKTIPTGDVFEALLVDNFVMTCAFCCRTDLYFKHVSLKEYMARGYLAGDYATCLDLARHTRFGYIDKSLARYRVLKNSFVHSTNLERAFEIEKKYQQIKLDYIDRYGASEELRQLAIEGIHQADFIFGFKMNRPEQGLKAYEWLIQHRPERYRSFVFRAMAASMRNRLLWHVLSRIANIDLLQRIALRSFSLRNRRPLDAGVSGVA